MWRLTISLPSMPVWASDPRRSGGSTKRTMSGLIRCSSLGSNRSLTLCAPIRAFKTCCIALACRAELLGASIVACLRRACRKDINLRARLRLRVGAALEGGAIVVGAVGIVAGRLLFGLLGFGAQRGLAGGVIRGFARDRKSVV